MGVGRYQYDRSSLSFKPEKRPFGRILRQVAVLFLSIFILALIGYFLIARFWSTPAERRLMRENAQLQATYDSFAARYDSLDQVVGQISRLDTHIHRLIFDRDPTTIANGGEADRLAWYSRLAMEGGSNAVLESADTLLDRLGATIRGVGTRFDRLSARLARLGDSVDALPSRHPIDKSVNAEIIAGYAELIHPFYKVLRMHQGIDYALPLGTPIKATASGKVLSVNRSKRSSGNSVVIQHEFGYRTVYSHLDVVKVRKGKMVRKGEEIATAGNTGLSMVPHLHYEVWKGDKSVDPLYYLFAVEPPDALQWIRVKAGQAGQSLD